MLDREQIQGIRLLATQGWSPREISKVTGISRQVISNLLANSRVARV